MRILLDENIPIGFSVLLMEHDVSTVKGLGWTGVKNGELLRRACGHFEVFVTLDRSVEFQQNIRALPFGVVVVIARSSRISDLSLVLPHILRAVVRIKPGNVETVRA